jgi:hypothetical protein
MLKKILGRNLLVDHTPLFRHPVTREFNIGAYFEPYVRQWLIETDDKTLQWVQAVRCFGFCRSVSTAFPLILLLPGNRGRQG